MNRSAIYRGWREPTDRRQVRLIQALLAFPVAGVIGFAGNEIVTRVVTSPPAMTAPVQPERTTDEDTAPREHRNGREPDGSRPAGVA